MAKAEEDPMTAGVELINSMLQDFLNRTSPDENAETPRVGITLTCPAFEDSPIIGTLLGFEEVSGRTVSDVIGRNCRFLNRGCQNDQSALQFMREIQASPEAARDFTRAYPEGKEFLLMNVRPTRTSPETTDNPSVFFFNLIHIFGGEVAVAEASYPVLCGVQSVMMLDSNIQETTIMCQHIHRLLTSRDSAISEVFHAWCRIVLSQFIQLEKASLRESGLSVPRSLEDKKQVITKDFQEVTECREKIMQLIASLNRVEEIANMVMNFAEPLGEHAVSQRHLAQTQLTDIVGLRAQVFTEFRADLLQFMSWYIVKANLEGSLEMDPPLESVCSPEL
jgi:hypothetical protein